MSKESITSSYLTGASWGLVTAGGMLMLGGFFADNGTMFVCGMAMVVLAVCVGGVNSMCEPSETSKDQNSQHMQRISPQLIREAHDKNFSRLCDEVEEYLNS